MGLGRDGCGERMGLGRDGGMEGGRLGMDWIKGGKNGWMYYGKG